MSVTRGYGGIASDCGSTANHLPLILCDHKQPCATLVEWSKARLLDFSFRSLAACQGVGITDCFLSRTDIHTPINADPARSKTLVSSMLPGVSPANGFQVRSLKP